MALSQGAKFLTRTLSPSRLSFRTVANGRRQDLLGRRSHLSVSINRIENRLRLHSLAAQPSNPIGSFTASIIRFYSSAPASGSGNDDGDPPPGELAKDMEDLVNDGMENPVVNHFSTPGVPATQTVPDVWPTVPVIALNKHPVFPKFIKIVEITNPTLMEILRRKVRLNRPYAGVFNKKNDDDYDEVITDLDHVYPIGTFVQIMEMQDMGNKLRMVVMAHRRIKLLNSVVEEEEPEAKPDQQLAVELQEQPVDATAPVGPTPGPITNFSEPSKTEPKQKTVPENGIFTVNTENVVHEPFETTAEIKALTQEVIKTIRDIIVSWYNLNLLNSFLIFFSISGFESVVQRILATNAATRPKSGGQPRIPVGLGGGFDCWRYQ